MKQRDKFEQLAREQLEAGEELLVGAVVRASAAGFQRNRSDTIAYLGLTSNRLLVIPRGRSRGIESLELGSFRNEGSVTRGRDGFGRPTMVVQRPEDSRGTRFAFGWRDAVTSEQMARALLNGH